MKKGKLRTILAIGKDDAHYGNRALYIGLKGRVTGKSCLEPLGGFIDCYFRLVDQMNGRRTVSFYKVKLSKED